MINGRPMMIWEIYCNEIVNAIFDIRCSFWKVILLRNIASEVKFWDEPVGYIFLWKSYRIILENTLIAEKNEYFEPVELFPWPTDAQTVHERACKRPEESNQLCVMQWSTQILSKCFQVDMPTQCRTILLLIQRQDFYDTKQNRHMEEHEKFPLFFKEFFRIILIIILNPKGHKSSWNQIVIQQFHNWCLISIITRLDRLSCLTRWNAFPLNCHSSSADIKIFEAIWLSSKLFNLFTSPNYTFLFQNILIKFNSKQVSLEINVTVKLYI